MSTTTPNYQHLVGRAEQEEIKLLDGVHGSLQGMYKRKLPYQMDYSVRTLEKQLIDEGNIHILDLRVSGKYRDNFEWLLYADGYKILSGTKDFAHECFVKDAELFRKTCRKAVEESGLPSLTKREYLQIFGTRNMLDYFRKTSDISEMHITKWPRENHLLYSK